VRRSCERESLASMLSDQVGTCLVGTRVASRQRPVPGEHKDRNDHPCEHGEDADSSRQAARQICMPGRSGLYSGQYTKTSTAKNKADKRVRLCLTETRRRRGGHRAAAVSRVEARYLPRKRLAFHPAKFESALTLARSDWQKRHVDEDAIAHGSEMISSVEGQCA
jgi:hypothetical protein